MLPKTKVKKIKDIKIENQHEIQSYYDKYAPVLFHEADSFKTFEGFHQRKLIRHLDSFSMQLKRNRLGLYVCDVKIQGIVFTFLVDTGAQISGILTQSAAKIKVETTSQQVNVGSIGGRSKGAQCVVVPQLFFGAIEILQQPLVLLQDKDFSIPYINIKMMKFDGILGWDILSNFDFELDDKNQKLSVLKSDDTFLIQNFIPVSFPCICLIDQNEKPAIFGFDSGARESWLGKNYVEAAKLEADYDQKVIGMGVLGFETMELRFVDSLDLFLHEYKISLQKIMTGRVDMFHNLEIAGVLGNKIFKGRKIQLFPTKQYIRIV